MSSAWIFLNIAYCTTWQKAFKINRITHFSLNDRLGIVQNRPSIYLTAFLFLSVPAASMTRLVRSRTASGSSVTSFDGNRSRSHTNEGNRSRSHTNEGRSRAHTGDNQRGRSHTDTMDSSVDQGPKSTEVSC